MILRDVAKLRDRSYIAIHRIDRFKGDQLRAPRCHVAQLPLQVGGVVVPEDSLLCPAVTNAFDHRGVVALVREHDAIGQARRKRRQRRQVRDIRGGEEQGGRLGMQLRQLAFQQHVPMIGAGDITRAAGSGAAPLERDPHGRQHRRMLAHAEIIVGAPDRDLAKAGLAAPGCAREGPGMALQIREHAIASFGPQARQGSIEEAFVVHAG